MSFTRKLPEWFAEGIEPTTTQKTAGYTPGLKPPAQWFNWHLNTAYLALKELQEHAVHDEEFDARFDTVDTKSVTLAAGVQVVNTVKAAPFNLTGLTGRMLVNLLGRMGGCETVGSWSSNVAIATDATNKTSGTSSFKLTLGSVPATASATFLTTPGKKYVAIADVKNGNTSKVAISINGNAIGNDVAAASAFAPSVVRFAATDYFHIVTLTGTGSSGNTFNMDSVRVYEISEADYAAAASLTPAKTATKYPYVDSVMPVRNPYAIRWTDDTRTEIASMLAMQTDLYADPVTGANADTVFERDGQYFKAKKWNSVTLDGSFVWTLPGSYPGYKVAGISGLGPAKAYDSLYVAKYDGKILTHNSTMTAADTAYFRNQTIKDAFDVSISSVDSGWGDSYTPTADEIKAYFMGWKMKQWGAGDTTPYTSGTKEWVQILNPVIPGGTTTLPTTQAPNWTPYQLVYQLAMPTVEPIVSEGQLSLVEGDNQVEVGTGIVLREVVKPATSTFVAYTAINAPTSANYVGSVGTRYKLDKFLGIYSDSRVDSSWAIKPGGGNGNYYADKLTASYDQSAIYGVTYLMGDKSPVASFVGSYAANEKTLLLDLVDSVQQANTRLSVVENKKAEKDSPAWIAPAGLLNGWTGEVQYLRLSDNLVLFRGGIRDGSVVPGTHLFTLPEGYRPEKDMEIRVRTSDGANDAPNSTIIIRATGRVFTQNNWYNKGAWFDGLSFLAKQ